MRTFARGLVSVVIVLASCTPSGERSTSDAGPAPAGACARFGQTCEIAPGKLGTCVEKTGCTGQGCLICQSQH